MAEKIKQQRTIDIIKAFFAIILVKFTFFLLVGIGYTWLLVGLGFQNDFSWNLSFLVTITLLLFSVLFERPYPGQVKIR